MCKKGIGFHSFLELAHQCSDVIIAMWGNGQISYKKSNIQEIQIYTNYHNRSCSWAVKKDGNTMLCLKSPCALHMVKAKSTITLFGSQMAKVITNTSIRSNFTVHPPSIGTRNLSSILPFQLSVMPFLKSPSMCLETKVTLSHTNQKKHGKMFTKYMNIGQVQVPTKW